MKRTLRCMIVCLTLLAVLLPGCAGGQDDNGEPSIQFENEVVSDLDSHVNPGLQIRVKTDTESIVFVLNDSLAAKSFYDQLPLTLPVENYSTNEKIFYPPEELDVSDAPPAEGPAGTLAYYEPWGNVVLFYTPCRKAAGLYQLGGAVSGTEQIENLSGEIQIEKVL